MITLNSNEIKTVRLMHINRNSVMVNLEMKNGKEIEAIHATKSVANKLLTAVNCQEDELFGIEPRIWQGVEMTWLNAFSRF